ncbi:Interferon-induced protein 44 [Takifugu flavidus]|uniref:Interferon-induced protein 44 n=1 Tax=Takifugu flavidus TaxID=433684 RepID=A0A5C6NSH4_9TELE|nr:Interferon-induced protein 44 [Takifugu flavidus]
MGRTILSHGGKCQRTTEKIWTLSKLTNPETLTSNISEFCCMDQLVLESPVSSTLLTLFYDIKSLAELSQMEIWLKAASPRNHYCVSINDIVGLEEGRGAHVDDIILALKGHVRDGYEFNPSSPLKEVMLSDVMVKKMRKIRRAASDMGIPQLAIITKGDIACPAVKDNVENLYKSKYLKQKFDGLCVRLGIPSNCVFLVKNYENETSPKDDVDAPILCALRQIISVGDNFLKIPQLAIITKGDKACPAVKDNVENLYKSKYLKEKVDELCVTLGIPLNCIFLVKNYDVVPNIKDNVDAPILCALRQIISFGERFLNDQQNNM